MPQVEPALERRQLSSRTIVAATTILQIKYHFISMTFNTELRLCASYDSKNQTLLKLFISPNISIGRPSLKNLRSVFFTSCLRITNVFDSELNPNDLNDIVLGL